MTAFLRSLVHLIVFYLGSVPIVAAAAVVTLVRPGAVVAIARVWAGWFEWCSRVLIGIRLRIEGTVPQHAVLVAVKHQSAYETIMVLWLFRAPAVVLKAELHAIPVWGLAAKHHGTIPVDRAGSGVALRTMLRAAGAAKAAGRPVIIFPEGTRTAVGAAPELRSGLAGLYRALKLPLIPVALDSGRCWPRGFVKHAGTITVRFGAPIPPGLERDEVERCVHAAINALN